MTFWRNFLKGWRGQSSASIQMPEATLVLLAASGAQEGHWVGIPAKDGTWKDPNTILWYSPALRRLLGYEEDEFPNLLSSWATHLHPEEAESVFEAISAHIEQRVPYDIRYRLRTKQGEYRWFRARGQAEWDERGVFRRMAGSLSDVTDQQKAEANLQQTSQELRSLARHLETIREEERSRISQDVHDQLGQILTVMNMDLYQLQEHLGEENASGQVILQRMQKQVEIGIDTVQKITTKLRPLILDQLGLIPALRWKIARFQETSGITPIFHSNEERLDLPRDLSTTIFRICGEALTNIARHAKAKQAWISLLKQNHSLVFIVRDDGIGLESHHLKSPNSFGLVSMRERALSWGGQTDILSAPNRGTSIVVKIPLHDIAERFASDVGVTP